MQKIAMLAAALALAGALLACSAEPAENMQSASGGDAALDDTEAVGQDRAASIDQTSNAQQDKTMNTEESMKENLGGTAALSLYTPETSIDEVASDPALGTWGRLLFPADTGYTGGTTLGTMSLTWYGVMDPAMTVDICNYVKGRVLAGETVFLDIYTDEEKTADPAKQDTGLFFFRGVPGAKTAIVSAGGGFVFVGAMHDSFPHCMELAERGYNAFALIYRPGAQTACEDLVRAIAYLHDHAQELQIDMADYSLWGGSAGARMAAWLGAHGTESFGEAAYPRPAMCVVNYTGLADVTGDEPPTYSAVGTSDGIASYTTMQRRIEAIQANGTDAEIEVFDGLGHGFGLGAGTVAEGWLDNAVAFWQKHGGTIDASLLEQANSKSSAAKHDAGSASAAASHASINIPQTGFTQEVPAEYLQPTSAAGTVTRIDYDTFDYAGNSAAIQKTAYVYTPYGYDASDTETRYNILYLMHGWYGHAGEYFEYADIKTMLDQMIERGLIEPLIVVSPTFYHDGSSDDFGSSVSELRAFHNDFTGALMPAVEGRFNTYAVSTSPEGLAASRDHRAFGGFSLGSVTTWMEFCHDADYVRYFLPMSGSCWYYGGYGDFRFADNVDFIESMVLDNNLDERGYFIYHAVGTDDSVKSQSVGMADEMLSRGTFTGDHYVFYQKEGGVHDHYAVREFIYNALPLFFGK